MKNKNIFFLVLLSLIAIILGISNTVYAEGESVNFSIINDGNTVFSGALSLPASGVVGINDTSGNTQNVDVRSVLNIIKNADDISPDFNISNLIYYDSFGAFYLKCININVGGELCDGWLYKVNGESPESGMDKNILSGGEEVKLFFGSDEPKTPPAEKNPVKENDSYSSGGGGSSGYRVVVQPVESIKPDLTEAPVIVSPIIPEVVPTKEEIKKIKKPTLPKAVQNKKVVNPVVANSAAVISAIDQKDNTPQVQKKSWVQKFLGWLFSF